MMRRYAGSADLQASACHALAQCKFTLRESERAAEAVMHAVGAHMTATDVAWKGCKVLSQLSLLYPSMQAHIGPDGVQLVLKSMRAHPLSKEVQTSGMNALQHLLALCDANRVRIDCGPMEFFTWADCEAMRE
jgi:hypothetical protein